MEPPRCHRRHFRVVQSACIVFSGAVVASIGCTSVLGDFEISGDANDGGTPPARDSSSAADAPDAPGVPPDAPGVPVPPSAPSSVAVTSVTVEYLVSTFAGTGAAGATDGVGTASSFNAPSGMAFDHGGSLFVADANNNRLRKVTNGGVVTTFAGSAQGSADGNGPAASFNAPQGVAADAAGAIYVADYGNNRIRRVSSDGTVSTVAGSARGFSDGTGAAAKFSGPGALAMTPGGHLLVGDFLNVRIRDVSTPDGAVTTLAGAGTTGAADGNGPTATFNGPTGIAVDAAGNAYVADRFNHCIRKVTPQGLVTTFAGSTTAGPSDGTGASASFDQPSGLAVNGGGDLYVADTNNSAIRKITTQGVVSTIAGGITGYRDGTGRLAQFASPFGIAVDPAGNLFVTESNRIRKIEPRGVGQLAVSWTVPLSTGTSPVTGFTATASAAGKASQTCTTSGALSCTISSLTSGVTYSVTVVARSAAGTSTASAPATATPN
jgi:serine/threonine-protein kinase